MERMTKPVTALFLTALLMIALSTCWNPIVWLDEMRDEVMQAKDMYLEVVEVTPLKNTTAFNPESPILIEFDRDIDPASVTSTSVVISPAKDWPDPTFDEGTNILTITPYALEGGAAYTITITTDVKGLDGSVLRTPYVWTFTTDNLPTGGLIIRDRLTLAATYSTTYSNERYVDLAIQANGIVNQMRYSQTSFTKDNDVLVWETVDDLIEDYELAVGSDGERTVYIQFRKYSISPAIDLRTEVKSDSIILDTKAPVVTSLGTVPSYLGNAGWNSNAAVDESGSGISSYLWTKYSGTGAATFTPDNALNTYLTPTAEGTLYVRLRAYDKAENTGYLNSSSMTIDMTPPTAPTVTGPGSKTTDISPNFTWAAGGGGNGTFRYKLESQGWTETIAASASSTFDDYGMNTMYVQERDAAGNWSASGYDSTFIYPSIILPAQGATVTGAVTLRWAKEVIRYYSYDVYVRVRGTERWNPLLLQTKEISYTYEDKLSGYFEWRYEVYYRGELTAYVPRKGEFFSFRATF